MNGEPKPGSTEEMRKWIDIVDRAQKGGVGALFGFKGSWAKFVSLLTAAAIVFGGFGALVQGLDAGRNFACQAHWVTSWCAK